ncbi:LysR family transcriptional regulator [Aquitalea sp. FJL05]|uniref:LysR family transcriptional regulator n=1 Tax=Aquitalea sp. FJL05 TaxID=2153366 RepID=UPI000F59E80A|nr:LysR family transcriptional regulator [Aquitalea sp. FJL05]RQO68200.1 LysR family transcriptional regulator [Aquitalea sp. FJL05]
MQYTLRQLAYLVAVADHGSVTAAANALYTSQPGISSAIAQLEAQFGLQFFIRHHAKGVSLTPAGQSFVAAARNLLAHAEDLSQHASALSQSLQGNLELGCFTTIAPIFLPRLLAAMREDYPDISVRLHEGDTEQLQQALLSGQTELALLYDLDLAPSLYRQTLQTVLPYVLLPATHPLAGRAAVSLQDLAPLPMVLLDLPHSREYFLSVFRLQGLEARVRHKTVNFELVRGLVAAGNGYALLNLRPQTPQTYAGDALVCLPIVEEVPALNIVLAWPQELRLTRRAEAFVTLCERNISRLG